MVNETSFYKHRFHTLSFSFIQVLELKFQLFFSIFCNSGSMSFLRPCASYRTLITFPSLRWMPCQSWGFLRWPGLDGLLRFVVVALLWTTFSEIRFIPSSSMFPTLRVGDRIIVEKESEFGKDAVFIKRIVAKAGDLVQVHHGSLYVNGVAQNENFIAEQPSYTSDLTYVPKGHVYVLGDNRNNSYDSHNWGPLSVENIVGRYVMCCYRPCNH
ncbi:chloroplast processing peptidase-like isoform X2 [Durio zibethinus]|uniref:Chloroplast processing peptidase-like isoform X2 n=1 Tax=Durio zibethinus TaxID=66656 RepID=A0A6P5Z8L3_DURZI|nr:chloroplast processing peptidase-like isoform X2 [Durio zibethinus]